MSLNTTAACAGAASSTSIMTCTARSALRTLRIFSRTKQVEEYDLGQGPEAWSKRVIDVMETFERHG